MTAAPDDDDQINKAKRHAKFKLFRALHILWMMCGTQEITAERLGITRPALAAALGRESTRLTLDHVKRAARMYVKEYGLSEDCNHYQLAAYKHLLKGIDPQAPILFSQRDKGSKYIDVVRAHIEAHSFRPLGYTVRYLAGKDNLPKKYVRQIVKRLVRKEPELANKYLEHPETEKLDPVDRFMIPHEDRGVDNWDTARVLKMEGKRIIVPVESAPKSKRVAATEEPKKKAPTKKVKARLDTLLKSADQL